MIFVLIVWMFYIVTACNDLIVNFGHTIGICVHLFGLGRYKFEMLIFMVWSVERVRGHFLAQKASSRGSVS
jgi:hypothetical protein